MKVSELKITRKQQDLLESKEFSQEDLESLKSWNGDQKRILIKLVKYLAEQPLQALVSEREIHQIYRYQGKYEGLRILSEDLEQYLKKGD